MATEKDTKMAGRDAPGARFHVRRTVGAVCSEKGCRGLMWLVDLSRLEEALGHCGYQCDSCGARVKTVPGGDS